MNIAGIRKYYPTINLYSHKKDDTNNTSLSQKSNNICFRGTFDKYSDKNVILNPVITTESFKKFIKAQKDVDDDGNIIPRFDNTELKKLVDLSKDNKFNIRFIKTLINCQMNNYDESIVPRFNANDIEKLVKLANGNNSRLKFIKDLINDEFVENDYKEITIQRFKASEIVKLVKLTDNNPTKINFINKLIKEEDNYSNCDYSPRFDASEIETLVNLTNNNPTQVDFINDLIDAKTQDYFDGDILPRFDAFEIEELINLSKNNSYNLNLIKELMNEQFINPFGNKVHRFIGDNIVELVKLSNDNPNHIEFIKDLISQQKIDSDGNTVSRFDSDDIATLFNLLKKNPDNKNLIKDLVYLKQKNNNYILKIADIENILNFQKTNPELINNLVKNSSYNIFLKGISKNNIEIFKDNTILNKIVRQLNVNPITINTHKNYLNNSYQLEFEGNNEKQIFFINKNNNGFEYDGSETQKTRGDKTFVRREFQDGSHLVEEIGNIKFNNDLVPISLKKTQYNNKGIQVRSEVLIPSKDKPGTYTITVYERGLNQSMVRKPIGTVELYGSKNQGMKAKRIVASSDGTVTYHTIIQGPKGSGMKYEIKDKNGKILGTIERQYRKIDENHYTSSLNGQKYETEFIKGKIIVSKLDNNSNKIETIKIGSDILDPKLKNLYKQLPGDYFFKINEIGLNKICLNKMLPNGSAYYYPKTNNILISNNLKNNSFIFAHELGHAIDNNHNPRKIRQNRQLINMYKKELANYKKITSDAEGKSIGYFTPEDKKSIPIDEVIAEFYALTSGLINQDCESIQLRSVVLQQHFPRTCAKIIELMNN